MTDQSSLRIRVDNLSKQFGGQVAVNQVSCDFNTDKVTAVIGPNGAGKSTLLNLISGQLYPSWGDVYFNDIVISHKTPAARARLGIGRAFQKTNLFPKLSVLENIRLSVQMRSGIARNFWRSSASFRDVTEKAEEYLEKVNLADKKDLVAGYLSHGQQRRLEIGVLMAMQPRVFILDEPTNGMSLEEVPAILDLIIGIRSEEDIAVILVEHKMDVVSEVAERVVVMHNGNLIADGSFEHVMNSPEVQGAYLGVQPDAGMRFVQ